jgi:Fe-S oxidoreductase
MESCVSCKGCRRECEAELDMALIKVEYQAQRILREGLSLRARLFGHLPLLLHRWPWLGRLITLRNRTPWLARLAEFWLGIDARARLPEPVARPDASNRAEQAGFDPEASRDVVLLIDSFSRYYQPDIVGAATAVLEAAGCRVLRADPLPEAAEPDRPLCCGRTYLSQGMVAEAHREARRTLQALLPHVAAGRTIIGLEPACLLALRDEWKALDLGEGVAALAAQTVLLEEFLAREQLPRPLAFKPPAVPLLVHGHCHQKAAGAMKSLRKVLKLVPGLQFEFIEASCCGMAGSFGFEAEHAQMARTMAEQALLPRLRQHPEAMVLSNGYSCRSQIQAGADRQSVHLAQWLRDHLADPCG